MDKFIFNNKNPLIHAENDIKSICNPAFKKFNLRYFSYGKFYDDGKCILLSTNKDIFVNHFKKQYKLTVPPDKKQDNKDKIYNLIFINDESPDIIIDEYNLFQHGTMIDLIRKYKGYYEMFCYVSNNNSIHPANEFLNQLDWLDSFSTDFLFKAYNIIQRAQKNLIILPEIMQPDINGASHNLNPSCKSENLLINLSKRQYECLALLSLGKSAKEIANILNLSYRTIETHIELLKEKLNLQKQSDLIAFSLKNNLNVTALTLIKDYEKRN